MARTNGIEGIYRRHVQTVYRVCYSYLGSAADAEDAVQATFMKLVEHPRSFESEEHEKAWLIVAAKNHCLDVLRSASYSRVVALDESVPEPSVEDEVFADEPGEVMQAVLGKKTPLSKLTQDLKIYPQVLKNVKVQDKDRALNDFAVQSACKEVAETLGDQGRILLRKSGTEPVIRVMVEAQTQQQCEEQVDAVIHVMKERGLAVEGK